MYFLTDKDTDSAPDYYSHVSAQVKDRLQEIDGKEYYFDKDGVLQTNQDITINGKNYHLDDTGVATAEDLNIGGHREERTFHNKQTKTDYQGNVYMDKNGNLVTGLQKIEGKTYFFSSDGEQYKNAIIEQPGGKLIYLTADSGEMVTNQTIQLTPEMTYKHSDSVAISDYYKNGWLHFGADGIADSDYRKTYDIEYNLYKDVDGLYRWRGIPKD